MSKSKPDLTKKPMPKGWTPKPLARLAPTRNLKVRRAQGMPAKLSDTQRKQLIEWFVNENPPYSVVIGRMWSLWGIETSSGALSNFFRKHCFPILESQDKAFHKKEVLTQIILEIRSEGPVHITASPRR